MQSSASLLHEGSASLAGEVEDMALLKECPHCRTAARNDAEICDGCNQPFRYIGPCAPDGTLYRDRVPHFFVILWIAALIHVMLVLGALRLLIH